MTSNKTIANDASIEDYLDAVKPAERQADAKMLYQIFCEVTGEKGQMWGDSIVGFGRYQYRYASGRSGEWMRTGFAARKSNLSLYIMNGFAEYEDLLTQLGKHKTAKSCLYITRLEQIDTEILKKIIYHSFYKATYCGEQ